MIVYSRFNCRHYCLERNPSKQAPHANVERNIRRMNLRRFATGWLRERIDLFNTYTVPSILNQTNQEFSWIGIAHPDSPKWFIEELSKTPRMELCISEWDIDVKELGHTTVNLDTDDALARTFIDEAYKVDFEGETTFSRGMRFRAYINCWADAFSNHSHFNIVQHPKITVLDFSHGMRRLNKNVIDSKSPMWLEVIHNNNISNGIRTSAVYNNLGPDRTRLYFDVNHDKIKQWRLEKTYGRMTL